MISACIIARRISASWIIAIPVDGVKHLVIAAHAHTLRRRRQAGWDVRFHVSISNMKEWNECVFAVPTRSSSCLLNWFIPSIRDLQRLQGTWGRLANQYKLPYTGGGGYIENQGSSWREEKQWDQITFYRKSFPINHISGAINPTPRRTYVCPN